MMIANLVGFCLGVDGTKDLLHGILSRNGALFVIMSLVALFSATNIMFEIREHEKRKAAKEKQEEIMLGTFD